MQRLNFRPMLIDSLKGYTRQGLTRDLCISYYSPSEGRAKDETGEGDCLLLLFRLR